LIISLLVFWQLKRYLVNNQPNTISPRSIVNTSFIPFKVSE